MGLICQMNVSAWGGEQKLGHRDSFTWGGAGMDVGREPPPLPCREASRSEGPLPLRASCGLAAPQL